MNARQVAVLTVLSMAARVLVFSVVLEVRGASTSALPVFLAFVAVVATLGLVSVMRLLRGRERGR